MEALLSSSSSHHRFQQGDPDRGATSTLGECERRWVVPSFKCTHRTAINQKIIGLMFGSCLHIVLSHSEGTELCRFNFWFSWSCYYPFPPFISILINSLHTIPSLPDFWKGKVSGLLCLLALQGAAGRVVLIEPPKVQCCSRREVQPMEETRKLTW